MWKYREIHNKRLMSQWMRIKQCKWHESKFGWRSLTSFYWLYRGLISRHDTNKEINKKWSCKWISNRAKNKTNHFNLSAQNFISSILHKEIQSKMKCDCFANFIFLLNIWEFDLIKWHAVRESNKMLLFFCEKVM